VAFTASMLYCVAFMFGIVTVLGKRLNESSCTCLALVEIILVRRLLNGTAGFCAKETCTSNKHSHSKNILINLNGGVYSRMDKVNIYCVRP